MSKWIIFITMLALAGCETSEKSKGVVYEEEEIGDIHQGLESLGKLRLSEYGFFKSPLSELIPAEHVFPYEMNTPLFTDYAQKKRFIFIPEGTTTAYHDTEALEFPTGTVLIKNFYYDEAQLNGESRIIETRLLIHEESGWKALPYIWNEEQTDAFLEITGGERLVSLTGKGTFSYAVPNMAQCKSCHEYEGAIAPIGPTARQLNKSVNGNNQLKMLEEAGALSGLPDFSTIKKLADWDDDQSGSLDERARAYLEINCGHCHRPEGPGKNSGLDLTLFSKSDHALGIYKSPVAAGAGSGGFQYDIVPGNPDASILLFRMKSEDPGIMMPELGRKLVHSEGVALIKQWISSMN